jgi:RNA polymerase sigma-70 factor (ECF subfamily)
MIKKSVINNTTDEAEKAFHLECMRKVAENRDEQAFTVLFEHFVPKLRAYSLAAQPGAALLADELAQEVMVKLWNKAHTFNPSKAGLNTWIFTLARNARIDYFRKNGRFLSEIEPDLIFANMTDDTQDPFSSAQNKAMENQIKEAINELPSDQAQAISKVFMEGKSHQLAADELGLPLGTVKSRVRLALGKLELLIRR